MSTTTTARKKQKTENGDMEEDHIKKARARVEELKKEFPWFDWPMSEYYLFDQDYDAPGSMDFFLPGKETTLDEKSRARVISNPKNINPFLIEYERVSRFQGEREADKLLYSHYDRPSAFLEAWHQQLKDGKAKECVFYQEGTRKELKNLVDINEGKCVLIFYACRWSTVEEELGVPFVQMNNKNEKDGPWTYKDYINCATNSIYFPAFVSDSPAVLAPPGPEVGLAFCRFWGIQFQIKNIENGPLPQEEETIEEISCKLKDIERLFNKVQNGPKGHRALKEFLPGNPYHNFEAYYSEWEKTLEHINAIVPYQNFSK